MSNHPIAITLDPDKGAVEAWQKAAKGIVKPHEVNQAIANAVNRTLQVAKTQALREATSQYTVKRGQLTKTIKTYHATSTKLHAELRFTGARMPALEFSKIKPKTVQPQKGIPVSARPGVFIQFKTDGGGQVPHAAVINLGQEPQVYTRKGKDGSQLKDKYELSKFTGPSVVSMVGNPEAAEAIQNSANESLSKRIDHEMKRILEK